MATKEEKRKQTGEKKHPRKVYGNTRRRKKGKNKRVCEKCGKKNRLSECHIFPGRYYRDKSSRARTYLLCQGCRMEIDKILPRNRKFSKRQYIIIYMVWMRGDKVEIPKSWGFHHKGGFYVDKAKRKKIESLSDVSSRNASVVIPRIPGTKGPSNEMKKAFRVPC